MAQYHNGRAAIRHYANQTALLTFASTSQFHVYLPWGQRPFSIVFFVFKESLEEKGCSPSLWIPNVQFAARKCLTHFAILHCAGTWVTPATTDNTSLVDKCLLLSHKYILFALTQTGVDIMYYP